MPESRSAIFRAPINIAVLKYWGKKDVHLNIPLNDSISVTLEGDDIGTQTEVIVNDSSQDDISVFINDKDYTMSVTPKLLKILNEIRAIKCDKGKYKVEVRSTNFSPTASGLASSASGYAALTACLMKIFEVPYELESCLARLGSGSACRSMLGSFVHWEKGGLHERGHDSKAVQIADEHFWPELKCIIYRLDDEEKKVSSTEGMKRSVETSQLLNIRISEDSMRRKVEELKEAILNRDFEKFGELTMRDSNQIHAICLDTYPPLFYLNKQSLDVIEFIHSLNVRYGKVVSAYTFDAGPHPVIFTTTDIWNTLEQEFLDIAKSIGAKLIFCNLGGAPKPARFN